MGEWEEEEDREEEGSRPDSRPRGRGEEQERQQVKGSRNNNTTHVTRALLATDITGLLVSTFFTLLISTTEIKEIFPPYTGPLYHNNSAPPQSVPM